MDTSISFKCTLARRAAARSTWVQRVVKDLTQHLKGKHHHVFFDNFFTSEELLRDLAEEDICACGTARKDRRGFPPALKTVKLKNRSAHSKCTWCECTCMCVWEYVCMYGCVCEYLCACIRGGINSHTQSNHHKNLLSSGNMLVTILFSYLAASLVINRILFNCCRQVQQRRYTKYYTYRHTHTHKHTRIHMVLSAVA